MALTSGGKLRRYEIMSPLGAAGMNRFQISPEERARASRFAHDDAEYRAKVRGWL